jgi:hypothetical protein
VFRKISIVAGSFDRVEVAMALALILCRAAKVEIQAA